MTEQIRMCFDVLDPDVQSIKGKKVQEKKLMNLEIPLSLGVHPKATPPSHMDTY